MKKTNYGLLFLALTGIGFASCEKESAAETTVTKTESTQDAARENMYYYAIGAETLSQELAHKKYDLYTSLFTSSFSLNNHLYHGVAGFKDDVATLYKDGTSSSSVLYESADFGDKYGAVKYAGTDILMDEIELIGEDINKLYALRGASIYKLTYVSNGSYFDATIIYSYPTSFKTPRRFSIAPVIGNETFLRLYTAPTVYSQVGTPPPMTTLSYIDMNPTNGLISLPVNVGTQVSGQGNLSSFTTKDYFYVPATSSDYFVVIEKDIYKLDASNNLVLSSSFANSVRDCSYYYR